MAKLSKPNRLKGLFIGLLSGAAGAYAMRAFDREVAPRWFPETNGEEGNTEETFYNLGQEAYTQFGGRAPRAKETRQLLAELAYWGMGIIAGGMYGGTRSTTKVVDSAGSFWYGVRLWLAETFLAPRAGVKQPISDYSMDYHLRRLLSYWAFSLTTVTLTRLLYRLLTPKDWFRL